MSEQAPNEEAGLEEPSPVTLPPSSNGELLPLKSPLVRPLVKPLDKPLVKPLVRPKVYAYVTY